ncbi:hypothetical protein [Mycolicibacterium peregrinum]|uniref:hypothetical protein n=1 Tax=Mycolicibacterium peregrinum TaxID=43304 RepID=UPI003AAB47AB
MNLDDRAAAAVGQLNALADILERTERPDADDHAMLRKHSDSVCEDVEETITELNAWSLGHLIAIRDGAKRFREADDLYNARREAT